MIVMSMNRMVGHWIRSTAERLTSNDTPETVAIHPSPTAESWESCLRCYLEIGVG